MISERDERRPDRVRIDGPEVLRRTRPAARRTPAGAVPSAARAVLDLLEKMITAMPVVKPVTTGYGMNLIAAPSRASPKAMRISPAMIVATSRPSTPYVGRCRRR